MSSSKTWSTKWLIWLLKWPWIACELHALAGVLVSKGRSEKKGELKMADCKDGCARHFLIYTKIKYKTLLTILNFKWRDPWDEEHPSARTSFVPVLHANQTPHTHGKRALALKRSSRTRAAPAGADRPPALHAGGTSLPAVLFTPSYCLCHVSSSKPRRNGSE